MPTKIEPTARAAAPPTGMRSPASPQRSLSVSQTLTRDDVQPPPPLEPDTQPAPPLPEEEEDEDDGDVPVTTLDEEEFHRIEVEEAEDDDDDDDADDDSDVPPAHTPAPPKQEPTQTPAARRAPSGRGSPQRVARRSGSFIQRPAGRPPVPSQQQQQQQQQSNSNQTVESRLTFLESQNRQLMDLVGKLQHRIEELESKIN